MQIYIMSIIFQDESSAFISHEKYINQVYCNIEENTYQLNPSLFEILSPYKTSNKDCNIIESLDFQENNQLKNIVEILRKYNIFIDKLYNTNILAKPTDIVTEKNKMALKTSDHVYKESGKAVVKDAFGANIGPPSVKMIGGQKYLFPENSSFYASDVLNIEKYLVDKNYDAILLDPPWWNKYIRRKRKKSDNVYQMMYNDKLKDIPIEKLLKDDGLLIVWCTNSEQHHNDLVNDIFPKWNVEYVSQWYWLKITKNGEPVCNFSKPPGKQPFEKIIFARRNPKLEIPHDGRLVLSVPSALHSHKPPLVELIKRYLPQNHECLEIFGRYLLPGWTSYGNEVLRLQHECLYIKGN